MAVLTLENITLIFHQNTQNQIEALRNINLEIQEGDFITLVGGNGAGKSTLLNIIAGEFTPQEGRVLLGDEDVTKLSPVKRAKYISRVFQDPKMGTAPRMTIEENLAIAMRNGDHSPFRSSIKGQDIQTFMKNLSLLDLGLEGRLKQEMGLLSGGQRQSIALLMATLCRPKILLLDEHTAALDAKTSQVVMKLSEKIVREQGLTALMITHDLQDAIDYGNRIIIMEQGRIKEDLVNDNTMTKEELFVKIHN